jgi:predicted nucleic acid-binding Zn ribbon protein
LIQKSKYLGTIELCPCCGKNGFAQNKNGKVVIQHREKRKTISVCYPTSSVDIILGQHQKRICRICGKLFNPTRMDNLFCSKQCGDIHHQRQKIPTLYNKEDIKIEHQCVVCGKSFIPWKSNQRFCSKKCNDITHRAKYLGYNSHGHVNFCPVCQRPGSISEIGYVSKKGTRFSKFYVAHHFILHGFDKRFSCYLNKDRQKQLHLKSNVFTLDSLASSGDEK